MDRCRHGDPAWSQHQTKGTPCRPGGQNRVDRSRLSDTWPMSLQRWRLRLRVTLKRSRGLIVYMEDVGSRSQTSSNCGDILGGSASLPLDIWAFMTPSVFNGFPPSVSTPTFGAGSKCGPTWSGHGSWRVDSLHDLRCVFRHKPSGEPGGRQTFLHRIAGQNPGGTGSNGTGFGMAWTRLEETHASSVFSF